MHDGERNRHHSPAQRRAQRREEERHATWLRAPARPRRDRGQHAHAPTHALRPQHAATNVGTRVRVIPDNPRAFPFLVHMRAPRTSARRTFWPHVPLRSVTFCSLRIPNNPHAYYNSRDVSAYDTMPFRRRLSHVPGNSGTPFHRSAMLTICPVFPSSAATTIDSSSSWRPATCGVALRLRKVEL